MKRLFYSAFFFIFLALVSVHSTLALSVTPAIIDLPYTPGEVITKSFQIFDTAAKVQIATSGMLAQENTLSATELDIKPNQAAIVTVTFTMPTLTEPGAHYLDLRISETQSSTSQGNAMALGAIIARIRTSVPFPGKYISTKLQYPKEVTWKETIDLSTIITNLGTESIDSVRGTIRISTKNHTLIDIVPLNSLTDVIPQDSQEMHASYDTSKTFAGEYYLSAEINYDGDQTQKTAEYWMSIGKVFLEIIELKTTMIYAQSITPIHVEVKNWWNEPIATYAKLTLKDNNGKILKKSTSATITVERLSTQMLELYLDAKGIEPGNYTAELTLDYTGHQTSQEIALEILAMQQGATGAAVSTISTNTSESSFSGSSILILVLFILASIFAYSRFKNQESSW